MARARLLLCAKGSFVALPVRRSATLTVLLFVSWFGIAGSAAQEPSPIGADVVERSLRSVGKVHSSGTGSGWIAAPDTVITNLHVARTQDLYFSPPGEDPIPCYVAAAIRSGDIAALKCPTGDRPVLARRDAPARIGEPVLMIGYPGGSGPAMSRGVVASVKVEIRGIPTSGSQLPASRAAPAAPSWTPGDG